MSESVFSSVLAKRKESKTLQQLSIVDLIIQTRIFPTHKSRGVALLGGIYDPPSPQACPLKVLYKDYRRDWLSSSVLTAGIVRILSNIQATLHSPIGSFVSGII